MLATPLPRDPSVSLVDFFEHVYKPLRLITASKATIQQYTLAIGYLRNYLGHEPRLRDLSEENLAGFMAYTVGRGLSPVTANMRIRYALALWRLAIRRHFLDDEKNNNPGSVDFLKIPRRLPVAWTEAEMERLIAAARLTRGRFMGIKAGAWWTALVLTLYDTGLRRAPAFAIRFEEIDFPNAMLRVPAERMKNKVEQYFRLHPQTIEAILETLPPKRKLLFPWPMQYERCLYGRFKCILRRAGLPFTKRDLFHKLRRTCASHLARLVGESMAIQQLGHSDASTIKRYVDPRFTANHDAARLLPRPGWTNPREIEIEVTHTAPEVAMGEPLHVRIAQADLSGTGDDVMARLSMKRRLASADVRDALEAMGLFAATFALELKLDPRRFQKSLRSDKPLSDELESKVRTALGLTMDKDGDGRNAGDRDGGAT